MTIPRLIHQTWKTTEVPRSHGDWVESVRLNHPDYEYRLWTDDENLALVEEHFGWFSDRYRSFAHDIERADAIRYLILWRFGGIYVDLDIEFLRPMDVLIRGNEPYFTLEAGPTTDQTVVSNALMAAEPGDPLFADLIGALGEDTAPHVTWAEVLGSTGPNWLERQLLDSAHSGRANIIGVDHICPRGVLAQNRAIPEPRDVASIRSRGDLTAIHHNTETWDVQRRPPDDVPNGYVLMTGFDIPGNDRAYVDVPDDSFEPIVRACEDDPDAVAFNFNGFVKGRGGHVAAFDAANYRSLKNGITPWVCIKQSEANELQPKL